MTTTPSARTTTDREAEHMRREVRRIQRLALDAVEGLDIAVGIAHLRSLRSLVWRARGEKIDLNEPVIGSEREEGKAMPTLKFGGVSGGVSRANDQLDTRVYDEPVSKRAGTLQGGHCGRAGRSPSTTAVPSPSPRRSS